MPHHVRHYGSEGAVGGQPLEQEGNQVEVILEEGVLHSVGVEVEGWGFLGLALLSRGGAACSAATV